MKLYSYYQSSASYRVRIALHLKGLAFDTVAINLTAAEQFSTTYDALNPQNIVPTLDDNSHVLTQSLAIMEYLDEAYPNTTSLLPTDLYSRAFARSLALIIAADTSPLGNLKVRQYFAKTHQASEDAVKTWMCHWIAKGLTAYERMLTMRSTPYQFSASDAPGLPECCLIPQLFNAKRWGYDYSHLVTLHTIEARCLTLAAFRQAHPSAQPDAPKEK